MAHLPDRGELGAPGAVDDVRRDLERRDRLDSTRSHSPLREGSDALRIDSATSKMPDLVDLRR